MAENQAVQAGPNSLPCLVRRCRLATHVVETHTKAITKAIANRLATHQPSPQMIRNGLPFVAAHPPFVELDDPLRYRAVFRIRTIFKP
jgi:hypothetical protein